MPKKTSFFHTNQFSILVNLPGAPKDNFSEHLSLYEMSKKWGNGLVIFWRFLNFRTFFGPFLGTVVKNAKLKKVAPGNSLDLKTLASKFKSLRCVFPKCTFLGAQIESEGPGMVSS